MNAATPMQLDSFPEAWVEFIRNFPEDLFTVGKMAKQEAIGAAESNAGAAIFTFKRYYFHDL